VTWQSGWVPDYSVTAKRGGQVPCHGILQFAVVAGNGAEKARPVEPLFGMRQHVENADRLQALDQGCLQLRQPLWNRFLVQGTNDRFALLNTHILVGEGRIRLACALFQPGAYMRDKSFSIRRQFHQFAIVGNLLVISTPRNELVPIVSILITALDVEIARFEIPEQLRKDGDLEVPPQDFVGTGAAFALPGHELPPGVRGPGQINQGNALFLGCSWLLHRRGGQPVPTTSLVLLEKADGLFQTAILTTGSQLHDRQQTEELRAMTFVERPEKLLGIVAHMRQVLFTVLEDLRRLVPNDRLHGR